MDQKNEQKAPLRIKNLTELKRCIRPGTELVATSHSKHPALVGLVRVVTEVQTNAYYSVVKDQPTHQYSTCNYGKGFRSDFEKASNYLFEGTTIKVLDRRSSDGMSLLPVRFRVIPDSPKWPGPTWTSRKSVRNTMLSMEGRTRTLAMCFASRMLNPSERMRKKSGLTSPPPKRRRVYRFRH